MPRRRAFIVAVETYAAMEEGLAATLPGTHAAASAFRDWLIGAHGLAPADVYFCAEDAALPGRTAGATKAEIVSELFRLRTDGKDHTDEVYFLYIGHGLCYQDVDGVRLADVLLCADYRRRDISGNDCLKIDEIQAWLRLCMGPADHYYFIDACRNDVGERDIKVGTLGLTYDNSNLGSPTVYTLYSVVEGTVAAADSGFVAALIDALNGQGRAKVWYRGGMAVLFRSVSDYVGARLSGQQVDQRVEGRRDGMIRAIAPIPQFTCSISVADALPSEMFVLTVSDSRQVLVDTVPFTGPTATFTRPPDDYMLAVRAFAAIVEAVDPLPADLYDDRTVRFVRRRPAVAGAARSAAVGSAAAPTVALPVPPHLQVALRNLQTGLATSVAGGQSAQLTPGRYAMEIADQARGIVFDRSIVDVVPDAPPRLDVGDRGIGPNQAGWLSHLDPAVVRSGGFDFSEALGPTGDAGTDLWLALFGASRIVADPGDFSKLGGLPLSTFDDVAPGAAQLYLLIGVEPVPTRVLLGVSEGATMDMAPIEPHPTLPGVYEYSLSTTPRAWTVSLQLGDRLPISFGACLLPDSATLLTVTTGEDGDLRLQQLVLPIRHLAGRLPPAVRAYFEHLPLRSVRQMVEVQRRFAAAEDLTAVLSDAALDGLIAAEWFEPITAILAGYDLARRGDIARLIRLIATIRATVAFLPDVEALAKLAGVEWRMPDGPPLVLDGFLSLNMPAIVSGLERQYLSLRGPWTFWIGASEAGDGGRPRA